MPFIHEQDERLFPKDFWEFLNTISREEVDKDTVRCPDKVVSDKMREVSPLKDYLIQSLTILHALK